VGAVRETETTKENTMATITKNYTVDGMTCGHCKASVEEEIGEITGVTSVTAELSTGTVTVTGEDIDDSAVVEAVAEAGYSIRS
jgi:copper chaperone